jgi:hypothetical protein
VELNRPVRLINGERKPVHNTRSHSMDLIDPLLFRQGLFLLPLSHSNEMPLFLDLCNKLFKRKRWSLAVDHRVAI